jgi:hypothetical protein
LTFEVVVRAAINLLNSEPDSKRNKQALLSQTSSGAEVAALAKPDKWQAGFWFKDDGTGR